MKLIVYTDGGARGNPGPAAIAFVVLNKTTGKVVKKFGKRIGVSTNNVAEYSAVVEAFLFLQTIVFEVADFFLDSQLVVNQLNGLYKIKDGKLKLLAMTIKKKERELIGKINYHLIPREQNKIADSLVNSVLDGSN